MRSTFAIIHLNKLKFNFNQIRKKVKGSKVLAVVKADAYGHGVNQVVLALDDLKNSPEYYGTALTDEGVELREVTSSKPILVFEPLSIDNINQSIIHNLDVTIFNESHLKLIKKTVMPKKINVHVKIDTGMGRLGINFNDAVEFMRKVNRIEDVEVKGVYTHFASSDEKNKKFAYLQLERFNKVISVLKNEGINRGLVHASNSGAILDLPEANFDMVRPGISLYGYYPSLETSESFPLKPVMSLYSEIDSISLKRKGESVSYGQLWKAKEDSYIATIPVGYADGFNRNLTNSVDVLIKGKYFKQVGRVTMDRICVDLKSMKLNIGEKVLLFGDENNSTIDAWTWGKILKTIPYEITCSITKRVPRVYR
jgi:alanine racemase